MQARQGSCANSCRHAGPVGTCRGTRSPAAGQAFPDGGLRALPAGLCGWRHGAPVLLSQPWCTDMLQRSSDLPSARCLWLLAPRAPILCRRVLPPVCLPQMVKLVKQATACEIHRHCMQIAVSGSELWPEGRKCRQHARHWQGIGFGSVVMGGTLLLGA